VAALPSDEQMGQDLTKLARVEVRNLEPCETFVPAGCNGLLRHGAIGPTIRQYYDAKLARGLRKGGELVTTAGVMRLANGRIRRARIAGPGARINCCIRRR